jgi:hypothetical protein
MAGVVMPIHPSDRSGDHWAQRLAVDLEVEIVALTAPAATRRLATGTHRRHEAQRRALLHATTFAHSCRSRHDIAVGRGPIRPSRWGNFGLTQAWVARLAEAHHAGRLQPELLRLGRYPLLVVNDG